MKEYAQKTKQLARTIQRSGSNQKVGFVDNRGDSAVKSNLYSLIQKKDTVIQMAYREAEDANVESMWSCRTALGLNNAGVPNNVAKCGNYMAASGLGGHSESKAIMLYLGALQANNINVHTERQPCDECSLLLEALNDFRNGGRDINVTAHYLVPFRGVADHTDRLKAKYRAAGKI